MEGRETEGLHALGRRTEYRQDYAPEVLESFIILPNLRHFCIFATPKCKRY